MLTLNVKPPLLSPLRSPHRLLSVGALITLLALASLACSEEPSKCTSDDDCREGFVCDLELYKGECVQAVRVIRCGERLCQYPPEVCVRDTCVVMSEVDGLEPPLTLDATPPADMNTTDQDPRDAQVGGSDAELSLDQALSDQGPPQDMSPPLDMSPSADMGPRDQGGQECVSACDCPPGLSCQAGACLALDEPVYCCSGDFCPPDQTCQTLEGRLEVCAPTVCSSACDCDAGLRCEQGVCVIGEGPLFCCNAGPCPAGQPCETPSQRQLTCEGSSGGGGGACTSACDCPSGQTCDNGACVFGDSPLFCCGASLCPSGQACETPTGGRDTCDNTRTCTSACDCTPGMTCEAGACVLGREPVYCCDDSANCPIDSRCQYQTGGYGRCF